MPDCKCKKLLIAFPTKEQNSDKNIAQSSLTKALVKLPFSSGSRDSNILTVCSLLSEITFSLRLLNPKIFESDLFSLFDLKCCTVSFFCLSFKYLYSEIFMCLVYRVGQLLSFVGCLVLLHEIQLPKYANKLAGQKKSL